jgi:hypothetical protein
VVRVGKGGCVLYVDSSVLWRDVRAECEDRAMVMRRRLAKKHVRSEVTRV